MPIVPEDPFEREEEFFEESIARDSLTENVQGHLEEGTINRGAINNGYFTNSGNVMEDRVEAAVSIEVGSFYLSDRSGGGNRDSWMAEILLFQKAQERSADGE